MIPHRTLLDSSDSYYSLASYVNVEYLLWVNRFNHPPYINDYFYCNVLGPRLQWSLNVESLIGFHLNNVGRAIVSMGQNYNYTTTLNHHMKLKGSNRIYLPLYGLSLLRKDKVKILMA